MHSFPKKKLHLGYSFQCFCKRTSITFNNIAKKPKIVLNITKSVH